MKKESYQADVSILLRQNRSLWVAVWGLVAVLILVLIIAWDGMGANRTIITPPTLRKSFWLTNDMASDTYLSQMGEWVAYLVLDVSPDNVDYKSKILLTLAKPDYHGALQQKLRIGAAQLKRDDAATSFDVRTVKTSVRSLSAIMTGYLKVYINGTLVKNQLRHYLAQFSMYGGQAQLTGFKRVRTDDFKEALTEQDDDDSQFQDSH